MFAAQALELIICPTKRARCEVIGLQVAARFAAVAGFLIDELTPAVGFCDRTVALSLRVRTGERF